MVGSKSKRLLLIVGTEIGDIHKAMRLTVSLDSLSLHTNPTTAAQLVLR